MSQANVPSEPTSPPPPRLLDPAFEGRETYGEALALAVWALVFFIDIPIELGERRVVDALPSFVGYLLLLVVAENLSGLHRFARSIQVVAVLATLTSAGLFVLGTAAVDVPDPLLVLMRGAVTVLSVLLVWWLGELLMDTLGYLGEPDLRRLVHSARVTYYVVQAVLWVGLLPLLFRDVPTDTSRFDLDLGQRLLFEGVNAVSVIVVMGAMSRARSAIALGPARGDSV